MKNTLYYIEYFKSPQKNLMRVFLYNNVGKKIPKTAINKIIEENDFFQRTL